MKDKADKQSRFTEGETENIEYKIDIPPKSDSYMKTVVAFANGKGGRIIFGVQDNTWEVHGFSRDEIFSRMDAVTNAIYDSCEPKIIPSVSLQEVDGNYIVIVEISSGPQRPYCIKSQGMIDGVYIRVSGTTRKASLYQIQEMILHTQNRYFDQEKVDRRLTDEEIDALCERLYTHAIEQCPNDSERAQIRKIGKSQFISYKLVVEQGDKCYATNGYQLLEGRSDEYPDATIQCAVFKGKTRDVFITRKEFSGSIDMQVESAYDFVLEHIDMGARFEGLGRQDIYELPIRSIREMITNAVCHRSYLCPGKIQVALYDDRLEVTSPGMLDQDLTIEKIKTGQSKIRNRGIAQVFAYMHMIEGWGSGIPDLLRDAQKYGLPEPTLEDRGSDFRINLYRKALNTDLRGVINPVDGSQNGVITEYMKETLGRRNGTKELENETKDAPNETKEGGNETKEHRHETKSETNHNDTEIKLTPREIQLLEQIRLNPGVTQMRLSEVTEIPLSTIKRILPELQKKGILTRTGTHRSGEWLINE